MREAVEELGVPVILGRLVGVYWEPGWGEGRGLHHFVFTAELTASLPQRSPDPKEISDFGWFAPANLPRPLSDFTLRRITDALGDGAPTLTTIAERRWLE
jgi:8-oxo-dGTP pyrophosphatase MutT (NUDIX family)